MTISDKLEDSNRTVAIIGGGPAGMSCALGYIATDQFLRTSIPNIYAAGDVTNPRDPCVATAVAQGAIVARSVDEDLGNGN